jgi:hypothetical protein
MIFINVNPESLLIERLVGSDVRHLIFETLDRPQFENTGETYFVAIIFGGVEIKAGAAFRGRPGFNRERAI